MEDKFDGHARCAKCGRVGTEVCIEFDFKNGKVMYVCKYSDCRHDNAMVVKAPDRKLPKSRRL